MKKKKIKSKIEAEINGHTGQKDKPSQDESEVY